MNLRLKEFEKKEYKTPIIFGPKGIKELTKKLSNIYELPAFDDYTKIEYREYSDLIELGEIKVRAFEVKHVAFGKEATACALRFEYKNKRLVFSGDSVACEGLEKAAEAADLFICDASYPKGKSNLAHLDTSDIGKISKNSKVKKVILNFDLVAEVKEKYDGEVVLGSDLLSIII